jgi:hypothetical protein
MIEEIDVLLDQANARVIVMRITSDPSSFLAPTNSLEQDFVAA